MIIASVSSIAFPPWTVACLWNQHLVSPRTPAIHSTAGVEEWIIHTMTVVVPAAFQFIEPGETICYNLECEYMTRWDWKGGIDIFHDLIEE